MSIALLVLNFLKNNWFPITICIGVFSIYLYIVSLQSIISDLETDLAVEQAKVVACHDNISNQNKVIEDWSIKTSEQNVEMNAIKTEITKLTKSTNSKIKLILNQKTPETCEEAMEYFIDLGAKYE